MGRGDTASRVRTAGRFDFVGGEIYNFGSLE